MSAFVFWHCTDNVVLFKLAFEVVFLVFFDVSSPQTLHKFPLLILPFFFLCFLYLIAASLESANSSILLARNLFKDFGGEKIRILC